MISKWIGMEVGSAAVKLAVIKGDQVLSMASARMPESLVRDGRVTAPAAMAALLKNMMKENGIRGGQCALVLPPQTVLCQHVTLPVMSEAELKLNLPFEFKDYVGSDPDAYDYDYIVTGINDGLMNLYAAAVRRDLVDEYWSICKRAGLVLKIATPAEMAWLNLITRNEQLPKKLAILDIGHHFTRIQIFSDGNFVMGKEIELAGSHLDDRIAAETQTDIHAARTRKETNLHQIQTAEYMQQAYQTLAAEIRKTVNYYNYSDVSGDAPLRDAYFCGGSAAIPALRAAISEATGLQLHPMEDLISLQGITGSIPMTCGIALGAAMTETGTNTFRSQNIPAAKRTMNFVRHEHSVDIRRMLPVVLVTAILLTIFVKVGILDQLNKKAQAYGALSQKQAQLDQINAQLAHYDELLQQYNRYSYGLMNETERNLLSRMEVLSLLEAEIAARATIQDFAVNNNLLTMNLSGITLREASTIVKNLESSDLVIRASVNSATAEDGREADIFISITLTNTAEEVRE